MSDTGPRRLSLPARPRRSRRRRKPLWQTPSSGVTSARPPKASGRKRAVAVEELPDWQELREAGRAIKERTLRHLDQYLLQLEESVRKAGGHVHWARDAEEANRIISGIAKQHDTDEVVKVKSIATDETKLNEHLESEGIKAHETDLAELIIQLAGETSSHILVPAIHKNRAEIREIFMRELDLQDLSDDPKELTEAARLYLRKKFLSAKVGISGANFAVAETGTICVVESEGNGRMCTTLPPVLVTLMGIEKLIPTWQDFEVYMQLLPRSSTAERMNPYTSFWTGVSEDDGPQEFHLVLLDNGRTDVLADEVGRQALNCIRCSACLNACPVYERTGGHAYNSVYPGPIGAILTPQLVGIGKPGPDSLPYASSLCGACYEVLSGQDQHPGGSDPPAGQSDPQETIRRPDRQAPPGKRRDAGDGEDLLRSEPLRERPEARPHRPVATGPERHHSQFAR